METYDAALFNGEGGALSRIHDHRRRRGCETLAGAHGDRAVRELLGVEYGRITIGPHGRESSAQACNTLARRLHRLLCQSAIAKRGDHSRLNGEEVALVLVRRHGIARVGGVADAEQVGTGLQGHDGTCPEAVGLPDRGHVESVGDDDPLEAVRAQPRSHP